MKPYLRSMLAVSTLLVSAPSGASGQTPLEIMDQVDRLLRGESSTARITMDIVTEHWERTLSMEVWSLGTKHALVRVTDPPREAGTATLMVDQEVWNYLPRVDRTIKVPPSLMMGSWMGSHFTNDDLVKESRMIDDYDITIAYEGDRDGEPVWEFQLTPKPEAPVVWGRIEYQVRKQDMMPTWARYFEEDGELVRTMEFSEYKAMGGRLVPTLTTVTPLDKPAERTSIHYSDLTFDVGLEESFFSLRNLRSTR